MVLIRRYSTQWLFAVLCGSLILVSCAGRDASFVEEGVQNGAPSLRSPEHAAELTNPGSDVLQAAISTSADAVINAINLRRSQEGLLPWVVDPPLVEMAYERSTDMAARGYLDHAAPGGDQILVLETLQAEGYTGQAAELVYATGVSLQEVANNTILAWFDDTAHQNVLFHPEYRFAGVGLMGDGSQWIVTLIAVEARPGS